MSRDWKKKSRVSKLFKLLLTVKMQSDLKNSNRSRFRESRKMLRIREKIEMMHRQMLIKMRESQTTVRRIICRHGTRKEDPEPQLVNLIIKIEFRMIRIQSRHSKRGRSQFIFRRTQSYPLKTARMIVARVTIFYI